MVTRSSIDPIEEARARVRLRYMRGRAATPGMSKVGVAAERLTRKSGAKKMPPIQVLKRRWREIAGEQLYKFCRPERLSGGKDGRVLTLRVLPQAPKERADLEASTAGIQDKGLRQAIVALGAAMLTADNPRNTRD